MDLDLVEIVCGGFMGNPLKQVNSVNKKLHSPNGPAHTWLDGDFIWCLHGEKHRYYGNARRNGEWYLHGRWIKT